ncbi:MAG: radical SAM protein [Actinomycetota bacterium]|nr:radical SAM protein [Actinomycetota bacterium]MDA8167236.1 radical SAM protein [Actinomycetota bacterium]
MYSPIRHIPQVFLKNRPLQFTLFVTARCNSRCPFCFYWQNRHAPRQELTLDEIEQVARSMDSLLWLLFSGGEIFMRQDLPEIVECFYRHTHPVIITLPTNGLAPGLIIPKMERILAATPESAVVVKVSLDGIGDEHDRLRNTPGSFEKAMETWTGLERLGRRHQNLQIGINTVFCRENQNRMDEIIDYVNVLPGCETHTISLVRGDPADAGAKDVDLEKYRRAIERLETDLKGSRPKMYHFNLARLKSAQDLVQRRLIYETVRQGRRQLPCYAGRLAAVMNEEGDVFPCEILTETFGNVRAAGYDLMRVFRSEAADRIRAGINQSGCYCSHECYFVTNILFNPRVYPRVLKQLLDLRQTRQPATGKDAVR